MYHKMPIVTTLATERPKAPPLLSRLTTNFGYLLTGRIASQGLSLLAMVYLARVLLPEAFGKVGFALSIVSYFLILGDMGLALWGAKQIGTGHAERPYLGNVISLRLALGIASFLALCLVMLLMRASHETNLLIFIFGLAVIPNSLTLDWAFLGMEMMKGVAVVSGARGLAYILLLVAFVKSPQSVMRIPWFFLLAWLCSAYLSWFLLRLWKADKVPSLTLPSGEWFSILNSSVPVFLYAILMTSYQSSATVLVGWLRDPFQVALYVAAYKPVLAFTYVVQEYAFSILPILCSSSQGTSVAVKSARLLVFASAVMALVATVFAKPGIRLLYGDSYDQASSALRILVWSLPAIAVVGLLSMDRIAKASTRVLLIALTVGFAAQVAVCLVLVPKFGAAGAATGYLASMLVAAIYLAATHTKIEFVNETNT